MNMNFLNIEECEGEEHRQAVEAFCDKFWVGLVSLTYTQEVGKLEQAYRFSDDSEHYSIDVIRKSLEE
jgi:hypothetical protein